MGKLDGMTASYDPLYETLKKRNLTMSYLVQKGVIYPSDLTRMNNGFDLPNLIARLCDYLQCSKEDVVEYITIPEMED